MIRGDGTYIVNPSETGTGLPPDNVSDSAGFEESADFINRGVGAINRLHIISRVRTVEYFLNDRKLGGSNKLFL